MILCSCGERGLCQCAQVDWRGDGGLEYNLAGLQMQVLSEGAGVARARAARARAAEDPPCHTLQECMKVRCVGISVWIFTRVQNWT